MIRASVSLPGFARRTTPPPPAGTITYKPAAADGAYHNQWPAIMTKHEVQTVG
jgi:hypothetical protein